LALSWMEPFPFVVDAHDGKAGLIGWTLMRGLGTLAAGRDSGLSG
jgi:hypothetical protein